MRQYPRARPRRNRATCIRQGHLCLATYPLILILLLCKKSPCPNSSKNINENISTCIHILHGIRTKNERHFLRCENLTHQYTRIPPLYHLLDFLINYFYVSHQNPTSRRAPRELRRRTHRRAYRYDTYHAPIPLTRSIRRREAYTNHVYPEAQRIHLLCILSRILR